MCNYEIVATTKDGTRRIGSQRCEGVVKCLRKQIFTNGITPTLVATFNGEINAFVDNSNCQKDSSPEPEVVQEPSVQN